MDTILGDRMPPPGRFPQGWIATHQRDGPGQPVNVVHRPGYAAAVDKGVEYFSGSQNLSIRKPLHSDGDGHLDGQRIFTYDGNQIVLDFRSANWQETKIAMRTGRRPDPGRGGGSLKIDSAWTSSPSLEQT